ncbi:mediator of RNA polymerase II transcription subunit 15a-like [Trifolium pratense]|uniref:mediator of RNA polymerase II transcription subunit 15a-like n=1 Tax=Trifolium pratense TaxID=57577 RepID=UPI001E697C13|nr:mediator of RNA polymerase II transcription subunit 15a-like [Trifolium pratense]XP_045830044.1 mediator of RNA polymerase II transcription subunit 15a-like [Trifolium pratense]
MDPKNWRLNQDTELTIDTTDWRAQLLPDSRQQIINKVLDTLKKHLPVNGSEGLLELQKIAQRFEDKIFTAATDESDYQRKISLKILSMDSKSRNTTTANNMLLNDIGPSNKLLSQGNCGIAPISVVERNAIWNQRKIGLNSNSKTIPSEVRPSSSTDPLGQEKEYLSTQPDHFKRQKVSLGNPSYSSERTVSRTPKAKDVFETWPSEKLKYEEELQRLTDQLKEKNELIAQLKEDNFNLATKSEGEKAELSAQLESSKKACENANTLLKDAQQSLEEVRKKHSDLEEPRKQ